MNVQIIADETPVARKPHRCSLCSRTIEAGETYRRARAVWDDGPYVWRECAHCRALVKTADADLRDALYWDDEGYCADSILESWEPCTVAGLRIKVHFRRRWQRSDGALYPVPDVAAAVAP